MTAIEIAKRIIAFAQSEGTPIGNLKLQYILFLLWKDVWKKEKRTLFWDAFAAWNFGPCVPAVYWEYCEWGGLPITESPKGIKPEKDDALIQQLLLEKKYLTFKAPTLKLLSTKPNGSWQAIWNYGKGAKTHIPFSQIVREAEQAETPLTNSELPEPKPRKTVLFQIKMEVEEDAMERLKKLEHHAEWLLDLDNWQEIKSVFECHVSEI